MSALALTTGWAPFSSPERRVFRAWDRCRVCHAPIYHFFAHEIIRRTVTTEIRTFLIANNHLNLLSQLRLVLHAENWILDDRFADVTPHALMVGIPIHVAVPEGLIGQLTSDADQLPLKR